MCFMKLNFDKEFMVKGVIIVIILTFFVSMFAVGMGGNNNNNNNNNDTPYPDDNYTLFVGQGNVALILKEYSGVINVNRISNESREYIMEGVKGGDVLYFNDETNQISIVLSNKSKTYEYAKYLYDNDSNISIVLKARVYSSEEFDFVTDLGDTIKSSIPESEINVAYPYAIGEILYYSALVQFLDGKIVGAQLHPLAKIEEMNMLFNVGEVFGEYYSRSFFNWRDREYVRNLSSNLNETLTELGAENVLVNYVSDITIRANRPIYSHEADLLKERFSGLKTINLEKIVFYDNSTESEDEISEYIYNITNGTIQLDFSPAMLEFSFKYSGNYSKIESVFSDIQNISIIEFYGKKAMVSTEATSVISGNSTYNVNEMEMGALIPISKNEGDVVTLKVDASIQANTIFEVEQVLNLNFE